MKIMEWKKEKRNVKDIYENPDNPRRLTKSQAEQIEQSLDKFGLCEPIVINSDGQIIGGHQRFRLLKKKGIKEIDVSIPVHPLTKEEVQELTVRLNKNTGDWNHDILANNFDLENLLNWGFDLKDLHLDNEEKEEKEKKFTITIVLNENAKAKELEDEILDLISKYNTTYKVKMK